MRVIAGTARSMPLKTVPGKDTRPTTDRIKETLFNILQTDIYDSSFLDLYAGSGSIGIEALSRGASRAVFVENAKAAVKCINENLKFTKLDEKGIVFEQDVLSAIAKMDGKYLFDIVFMDPPYGNDYEIDVLKALKNSSIIDKETIIIIEETLRADLSYIESSGFNIYKEKHYKTNKHVFFKLADN